MGSVAAAEGRGESAEDVAEQPQVGEDPGDRVVHGGVVDELHGVVSLWSHPDQRAGGGPVTQRQMDERTVLGSDLAGSGTVPSVSPVPRS